MRHSLSGYYEHLKNPFRAMVTSLVGISLQTILHFCPQATLVQQEAAIAKVVKVAAHEIARTEVDHILRVNDLWLVLRSVCQDVVIDVGAPNRPFEEILLWREGKPEPLVGNYIVKPGEQLIVEPSIAVPIDIRPFVSRILPALDSNTQRIMDVARCG